MATTKQTTKGAAKAPARKATTSKAATKTATKTALKTAPKSAPAGKTKSTATKVAASKAPAKSVRATAKVEAKAPAAAAKRAPAKAPAPIATTQVVGTPTFTRPSAVPPPPPLPASASVPPPPPLPASASVPPPAPAPTNGPPKVQARYVTIPPPPPLPRYEINLNVGDKAVHVKDGLGEVTAIEKRDIGGAMTEFYVLRILDNGMRVMVPTGGASGVLRPVMSSKEADAVLDTMRAREVAVDLQPWSRRFRAYTEMIKSGSPHEVAKVLRDMYRLKFDKDLSFGERRLLDRAKSLLMKELALAKKMSEGDLQSRVDDMFRA